MGEWGATEMSSTLQDYTTSVETLFRERLPGGTNGVYLYTHIGDFGPDEVRRYMKQTPAVVLVPLGVPASSRAGANAVLTLNYAAFILTRMKAEQDRSEAALRIMETIMAWLPFARFAGAKAPQDIEAANLYSGDIDKMGMALWAVRWRADIELPAIDDCRYNELADFLRLHAEYDPVDPAGENDWLAPQTVELEGPE